MDAIERAVGSDGAIPGFTAEETVEMLGVILNGSDDERTLLIERLFDDVRTGLAVMRAMQLGILVERIRQLTSVANDEDVTTTLPIPGHPDLKGLMVAIEARLPNIRTMHAYTQASLLQAIQRLAVDASVDDVRTLADAYLTLPSPADDDLDAD